MAACVLGYALAMVPLFASLEPVLIVVDRAAWFSFAYLLGVVVWSVVFWTKPGRKTEPEK